MPLEPLVLDTLTWRELVDAAIARLPAESQGAWTLHAPVDPGVTVLELLAYDLEQRLFLLDTQPEQLVRGALRLLGLDPPRPARAASTVLSLDAVADGAVHLPPAAHLSEPTGRLSLSTDYGAMVQPGAVIRDVVVDGRAVSDALLRGELVELGVPGRRVDLAIVVEGARPLEGRVSLYVALAGPDSATEVVGPKLEVAWSVDEQPAEVRDGTEGLRHSGLVGVALATGSRRRSITVEATYQIPDFLPSPVLTAIAPNAVVARNLVARSVDLASSDDERLQGDFEALHRPDATVVLVDPEDPMPLLDEPTTSALRLLEADGRLHDWQPVADLSEHDDRARVYRLDRSVGGLVFGDGYRGRIARPKIPIAGSLRYAIGGGETRSVAAGRGSWETDDGRVSAVNVSALGGGAGSELVADACARAASDHRLPATWTTAGDVVDVVRATHPELERARVHVADATDATAPCVPTPDAVTVLCVPEVARPPSRPPAPAAPLLDERLHAAVDRRLQSRRTMASSVHLRDPQYRWVSVRVDVLEARDLERVRDLLEVELARYLDPVVGGPEGGGWKPGTSLHPAALLAEGARGVEGLALVRQVAIGLGPRVRGADRSPSGDARFPAPESWEACRAVALGRFELPVLRLPIDVKDARP